VVVQVSVFVEHFNSTQNGVGGVETENRGKERRKWPKIERRRVELKPAQFKW